MAFIPEAIISKLVEQLISLPIEELKQEVRLVVGVKDQVKELTKNFQAIQDVLSDADQKQLKDRSLRRWLDELKEISYEMEDVLDKWWSAILLMKSHDHPTASSSHINNKVHTSIASCCSPLGEFDIASKIKDLNGELDEIAKRRNDYNLVSSVGTGLGERVHQRTTISDINITEVKGRVEEKEKIINMLLRKREDITHVPQIISIVGMGGLGKTTLAQLAYNNAVVENLFKKRIWVCVSDPFDEFRIAKAILESLGGSGGSELQTMVQDIKSRIGGEKYLLVLDDVWNEDPNKWKNVKAALMCGLPGSTILVTTRKDRVALIMGCRESNILRPGHLSKEECWSIMSSEIALSGMLMEELQRLEDIGLQIADKCKGLPLAAKALGGLLRFKDSSQEWRSVLNSEMWQLGEEEAEIENHLFVPLWLSYHDLSPADRQCLSYCICFPKDFEIKKYDLIKMWMAQGYLKETETKDMEIFAEEHFRKLSARSFFQNFQKRWDGQIEKFKMHDIVHDFVQFISKKECLYFEDVENEPVECLAKSVGHLFVFSTCMHKFPDFIFSFKKLRSLRVFSCEDLDLHSLFNELTCLRSLILSGCNIREIPSTIGRLIHLRLLDISDNQELSELPETIGDLCNLLVLNLNNCYDLKELPRGIGKLSNLRYLTKKEFIYLGGINLTQEIGRLNALREAFFRVESEACSLRNLNNLNHLNSVNIFLGRNVEHVNGAKQAQLNKKKYLVCLRLGFDWAETEEEADRWKSHDDEEEEEETERWKSHDEEVIEALQPCSNLEELVIVGYLGANLNPSWLLSLNHLRRVELDRWRNCNCLPPLGKLPSLTHLTVRRMKVKRMGVEFWGIDETFLSVVAFPKLEWLKIEDCWEWEEWEMDDGGHFIIMPRLTNFSVWWCNKLKAVPDLLLQKTTLKSFTIFGCSLLAERYEEEHGVDWPKISHIPNIDINGIPYRRGPIPDGVDAVVQIEDTPVVENCSAELKRVVILVQTRDGIYIRPVKSC